jgi:hypothetical protein
MESEEMLKVLEWAKKYKDKGFSVIPLIPNGKIPAIKSWIEYQNKIATDEELKKWFGNGSKNNIGIVTGKVSGVDVLDFDSQEAVQYAKDHNFPETPLVKTGKGFHCYYLHKDGVRNFQKKDNLPDIDLRADGGYVVSPPSIHASGHQYRWVEGKGLDEVPLGELPEIVLAKNTPDKKPLKELYKGVPEGNRNNTLTRLVGSWVGNGLTFDECFENACIWNSKNKPPLDEKRIVDTINSILKKHEQVDLVDLVDVESNKTDMKLIPLQPFPLEVLPKTLVGIIKRFSNSLGVEIEVIGSSMLTIVSSAIGNTIRVSPKYGYEVPVFIWLIIIAISGYGKTPAINTLVRPIEKRQSKIYKKYNEKLKRYKEWLEKSKKNKATETVDEPILEHFFVSDTTIEALGDIFENTPRGVMIHRDELAGLILGLNQYKGHAGNDRQHYLELFNCDSWKIDRKAYKKFIPNVGASIIGGIQDTTMPKVFKLEAIGEGLLPRFLLLNTEYKPKKFQRQGIEPDDLKLWSNILEKCYGIPLTSNDDGFVEPKVLILGAEALDLYEKFHNNYMNLIPFLSDNAKPFVAKFITYSLKMAGILHVLEGFTTGNTDINNSIRAGTMDRVIKLTNFYAGQSINALQLYGAKTKKELNELESKLLEVVCSLEAETKNGKLALSRICECLNPNLPKQLQCDSKQIGAMLRKQGLETKQSTNGYYFLLWEETKINKLKTTSTKSTMSTETISTHEEISPKVDIVDVNDMFREDDVVNLENEEVEIVE